MTRLVTDVCKDAAVVLHMSVWDKTTPVEDNGIGLPVEEKDAD